VTSINNIAIATPDFRSYPMHPGIVEASIKGSCVELRWADGQQGRFHHVWLRANSADDRSIDPHSRERIYDLLDFPLDIKPVSVSVSEQDALDVVREGDGHSSRFHPGWSRRARPGSSGHGIAPRRVTLARPVDRLDGSAGIDDAGRRHLCRLVLQTPNNNP